MSSLPPAQEQVAKLNIKKFNINEMQLNAKVAMIGKPGCWARGTNILLENGKTEVVEKIKVGDKLVGDDGSVRNVLELCHGYEMMYNLIPVKGTAQIVNQNHILVLYDLAAKGDPIIDITVEEYLRLTEERKGQLFWYFSSLHEYRGRKNPHVLLGYTYEKNVYPMTTFAVEAVGEGEYFGFILDSNHRFLMPDFSVFHNTGKSSLMKDLLYNHRGKFPCGLIMSETNKDSGDFDGVVPDLFMHDSYNQEAIDNFVIRQRRMVRKNGEQHPDNFSFIILDDCFDNSSWVHTTSIKGIFKNGRHWDLFFLLAMQYCLDIPPALRTSLDYIFILREPNLRNRRQLWENYASIFPTFNMFCDALDDLTQDYHCMVIKNRVLSNKIEDVVFWYKARIHKPFRVGTQGWWRWSEAHYNKQYEEEEEEARLAARNATAGNGLYDTRRGKNVVKLRVKMEP